MRKTFHKNIFLLPFRHMFSLKKIFHNVSIKKKNYLCKKIIPRKKQAAKHELKVH